MLCSLTPWLCWHHINIESRKQMQCHAVLSCSCCCTLDMACSCFSMRIIGQLDMRLPSYACSLHLARKPGANCSSC